MSVRDSSSFEKDDHRQGLQSSEKNEALKSEVKTLIEKCKSEAKKDMEEWHSQLKREHGTKRRKKSKKAESSRKAKKTKHEKKKDSSSSSSSSEGENKSEAEEEDAEASSESGSHGGSPTLSLPGKHDKSEKGDHDLWTERFTPSSQMSSKPHSMPSDELQEMLTEVLHQFFKQEHDAWMAILQMKYKM